MANSEHPKQTRQRARVSCAECRRLKLKCDRVWPCSSCKKRGAAHVCPTGTLRPLGRVSKAQLEVTALAKRLEELEGVIKDAGISHKLPPPLQISSISTSRKSTPPSDEKDDEEEDEPSTSYKDMNGFHRLSVPNLSGAINIPGSGSSGQGSSAGQPSMDEELESIMGGVGSLSIREADGRTRYLGASAGSAYFATGEDEDEEDDVVEKDYYVPSPADAVSIYPFIQLGNAYPKAPELERLRGFLPSLEEGERLAVCYWKYLSFMFEPLEESVFWEEYWPAAYKPGNLDGTKLACVFIVLALGTLFDPDVPSTPNALSMSYFQLSQAALSASRFLSNNTIAAAQTLQLSANILFNTHNLQEGGETFFPILGMALRLVVTMGLHRDGSRWGLTGPELDRRRLVFYELMTLDRMQAFISGRPYMINPAHFDTEMPANAPDYQIWKWKLGLFLGKVIDEGFSVKSPTYPVILNLDQELRDIFIASPSHLRCGALPETAYAVKPTGAPILPPQPSGGTEDDLKQRMRTHTLEMVFAQIFFYLHKPAFAQALQHYPEEPLASPWAASVAAVSLETGVYMLAIAKSWIGLHPVLCPRWWHIFFHAFAASVAQSSLVIKSPGSMLARHAWAQLNLAVETFELASVGGAPVAMLTPRLKTLRDTAFTSLQASLNVSKSLGIPGLPDTVEELVKNTDVGLSILGPSTRLQRHPKREKETKIGGSPTSSNEGSNAMGGQRNSTMPDYSDTQYSPFDSLIVNNGQSFAPMPAATPLQQTFNSNSSSFSSGFGGHQAQPSSFPSFSAPYQPQPDFLHSRQNSYQVPNTSPATMSPLSMSPSHVQLSMVSQANAHQGLPSSSASPTSALHLLNQHNAMLQQQEQVANQVRRASQASMTAVSQVPMRAMHPGPIQTPEPHLGFGNYALSIGGATWDSPLNMDSPPLIMNTPGVSGESDSWMWYDFSGGGAQL